MLVRISFLRAEDGTQTRDPQLGRLMLYQLSYFRKYNLKMCQFEDLKIYLQIFKSFNFQFFCGQ